MPAAGTPPDDAAPHKGWTPPRTCLPTWGTAELPAPEAWRWSRLARLLGPGIVMMGIQIGGGEWLLGPEVTARYGGGLMWIASVAIVLQVFYNLECGRYALYCGEPVATGFLRTRPGPAFWSSVLLLLSLSALIPGLSTQAAAVVAALWLDRPPGEGDRALVTLLAYVCLAAVALPVLVGGKIYNMLQAVMTAKVLVVLGFCLVLGVGWVRPAHWRSVAIGFVQFGNVPVERTSAPPASVDRAGEQLAGPEPLDNVAMHFWRHGTWPAVALANIAVLGAFAGYAGGGGLANSTYSNYVRDQGWGMGRQVGAIASAVGGEGITLSHLGKVFEPTPGALARWRGWWRQVLVDQLLVWAPGCFMGMALPALLSLEFAPHSRLYHDTARLEWSQAVITADGLRHAPHWGAAAGQAGWVAALVVGLLVLLPSQMSIVDDFSRRWTDILWSASPRIRARAREDQVKYLYYAILACYVTWTLLATWLFTRFGTPKLMTLVIANLNNLAIGLTSFHLLWINRRYLPPALRPRWYHQGGLAACGVFYLGLAALVFASKQWPALVAWYRS